MIEAVPKDDPEMVRFTDFTRTRWIDSDTVVNLEDMR